MLGRKERNSWNCSSVARCDSSFPVVLVQGRPRALTFPG